MSSASLASFPACSNWPLDSEQVVMELIRVWLFNHQISARNIPILDGLQQYSSAYSQESNFAPRHGFKRHHIVGRLTGTSYNFCAYLAAAEWKHAPLFNLQSAPSFLPGSLGPVSREARSRTSHNSL
jgi:hypothetical protein